MSEFAFISIDLGGAPTWAAILILLLALLGVLTVVVIAVIAYEELELGSGKVDQRVEFEQGPVDRGAAIPDFVNEDALRGLATHHNVEEAPTSVQKSKKIGISLNPFKWFGGSAEKGTTETRNPPNDMGELIRRVLRRLEDQNELDHVDLIYVDDLMVDSMPSFGDPNRAKETLESWLEENYPQGLEGVTTSELAQKLSRIGTEIPERALHERLKASFDRVKNAEEESVLFLEGEWSVEGEAGKLQLSRTDIRIVGHRPGNSRSIPLPDGASMKVQLDGELTKHGKNRIVGLDRPIRASIMATVRQCDPSSCSLDLTPIAVFQRVGSS